VAGDFVAAGLAGHGVVAEWLPDRFRRTVGWVRLLEWVEQEDVLALRDGLPPLEVHPYFGLAKALPLHFYLCDLQPKQVLPTFLIELVIL
jgi:hypothetical protein